MNQTSPTLNLKLSCTEYSSSIQKSLNDLLNIKVDSELKPESISQFDDSEDLYFSILFTGQVYGEFLFGLRKQTALDMLGIGYEPGQYEKTYWENRADILDAFKEVINMGAGQALKNLKVAYPDVSITPPKAIEGRITLSSYAIEQVKLTHRSGIMSCYVYIDYMKLDISETMEKNKRLNQAKSEFLSNMSHELRTPLNGMIGMLDILKSSINSPVQKEQFQVIYHSGEFLLSLISDILEFSKIESGKLEIENRSFDLVQSVEKVIESLAPGVFSKGLDLHLQVCPKTAHRYLGDETRIKQILTNLIGNAIKFTPSGSITLSVYPDETNNVVLKIKDTGIGIPKEKLATVFDSFSQVDVTDTRKYGGTGLGLTITKSIVAAMGGKITVESEEAIGTQFTVTIPLKVDHSVVSLPDQLIPNKDQIIVFSSKSEILESIKMVVESNQICSNLEIDSTINLNEKSTLIVELKLWNKASEDTKSVLIEKIKKSNCYLLFLLEPNHLNQMTEFHQKNSIEKVFFLTLPLSNRKLKNTLIQRPTMIRFGAENKDSQINPGANSKRRILVAEDNKINQVVIQTMIKKLGHEIHLVDNGLQAFKAIEDGSVFDLILMDCQMPHMDGYESTRKIREYETKVAKHTPIVALTANAFRETKEECFSCGMDDFATKPMTLDVLVKIIKDRTG